MVNLHEFGEGVLGGGRAPSPAQAGRSSAPSRRDSNFRFRSALRFVSALLLLLSHAASWTQSSPPAPQQTPASTSPSGAKSEAKSETKFGTIAPYLGLPIGNIELPGVPPEEAATLLVATPLKIAAPLTREALHDAMQALFATGRFADIQPQADRTQTAGVSVRSLTTATFFVGMLSMEGGSANPSA